MKKTKLFYFSVIDNVERKQDDKLENYWSILMKEIIQNKTADMNRLCVGMNIA